jgi:hypothetical protein
MRVPNGSDELMAVSKRLRFEILRRDNHACRYCGRSAPDVALTVDHVVPVTLGGSDHPTNLVTACTDCNSGKSSVPAVAELVADVAADALRWARAMRQATEQAQLQREEQYAIAEAFHNYWMTAARTMWDRRLPGDWEQTVNHYSRLGLTRADLLEAAEIALVARHVSSDGRWRYFIGTCKGMLRDRQEAAMRIVKAGEGV